MDGDQRNSANVLRKWRKGLRGAIGDFSFELVLCEGRYPLLAAVYFFAGYGSLYFGETQELYTRVYQHSSGPKWRQHALWAKVKPSLRPDDRAYLEAKLINLVAGLRRREVAPWARYGLKNVAFTKRMGRFERHPRENLDALALLMLDAFAEFLAKNPDPRGFILDDYAMGKWDKIIDVWTGHLRA